MILGENYDSRRNYDPFVWTLVVNYTAKSDIISLTKTTGC